MFEELGTFERAGVTEEDIQELLLSVNSVDTVTRVEEIEDGINVTALADVESSVLPSTIFIKLGSFNRNSTFTAEPFVMQLVQDKSRVATPSPLYYDYSKELQNCPWYITTALDGVSNFPVDADEARLFASKLGHMLGEINSIPTQDTGKASVEIESVPVASETVTVDSPPFTGVSWQETLREDYHSILQTMGPRFSDLRSEIEDFIEEFASEVSEPVTPRLVHFDYWWENVLWEDSRPYAIDWQRGYGGKAIANLPLARYLLFHKYDWGTQDVVNSFEDAYLSAVGDSLEEVTETEWRVYELYPRLREMRGFPYWWNGLSDEERDEREEIVRREVEVLLNDGCISQVPDTQS